MDINFITIGLRFEDLSCSESDTPTDSIMQSFFKRIILLPVSTMKDRTVWLMTEFRIIYFFSHLMKSFVVQHHEIVLINKTILRQRHVNFFFFLFSYFRWNIISGLLDSICRHDFRSLEKKRWRVLLGICIARIEESRWEMAYFILHYCLFQVSLLMSLAVKNKEKASTTKVNSSP